MSIRSLAYQQSVFERYYNSEVYPQDGGENQPERNYATVTLYILEVIKYRATEFDSAVQVL